MKHVIAFLVGLAMAPAVAALASAPQSLPVVANGAQAQVVATKPAASPAPADNNVPFADWLAALRTEALARGIKAETLDGALAGLEPLPVVIERDRTQAELVLPLDDYLDRRLTRKMVKTAREMAKQHRTLLRKVSAKYAVPPGIIVSVWGLESNFGKFSGVRPTIAALATLAYDARRSSMFREELFAALFGSFTPSLTHCRSGSAALISRSALQPAALNGTVARMRSAAASGTLTARPHV